MKAECAESPIGRVDHVDYVAICGDGFQQFGYGGHGFGSADGGEVGCGRRGSRDDAEEPKD